VKENQKEIRIVRGKSPKRGGQAGEVSKKGEKLLSKRLRKSEKKAPTKASQGMTKKGWCTVSEKKKKKPKKRQPQRHRGSV